MLLMQKYYTESKMIRMLDGTGRAAFKAIRNTDLSDDPEVFIEAGSLFRHEAQDRDAKVLELLQLGLLDPKIAMDELSFRTGNAFVSEKVRGIAHAQDMLDAVKAGAEPQIYMSDDLDAFRKVFTEFMQTAEFYALDDKGQDTVSEILVSINTVGQPPQAFEMAMQNQTVWPRPPAPPMGTMMPPMGPPPPPPGGMAPTQQPPGSATAAESMTANRGEALMTSTPGGGVL